MKEGGNILLFKYIKRYFLLKTPSTYDLDCQTYLIRSVKALMNNTHGLQSVMDLPGGISTLGLVYASPLIKIQTLVLEVLAAVCFVPPNGHQLVLEAMQAYKNQFKEKYRFETIVQKLVDEDLEAGDDAAAYLEHQVRFIHNFAGCDINVHECDCKHP